MNNQTHKIKRHKKASIAFPIIGGTLLVGGAAAGITIGLMKLPKVSSESGEIIMHPGLTTGSLEFKFKDKVKDGQVHAHMSGTTSNADNEPYVRFINAQGTEKDVTLTVQEDKVEAEVELVNAPWKEGEYSFLFDITFKYINGDNKEVEHKIENLRINYSVNASTILVTEPAESAYSLSATVNETGVPSKAPTIVGYRYSGEIQDASELSVRVIKGVTPDNIGLTPRITNLNTEDKTFDVAFDITGGKGHGLYDTNNLTGNLEIKFNQNIVVEQSKTFNILVTEDKYIKEPIAKELTFSNISASVNEYTSEIDGTFITRGLEGLHVEDGKLAKFEITPSFDQIDGLKVEAIPVASTTTKTFKVQIKITYDNQVLKMDSHHLSGKFNYKYNYKGSSKTIYGQQNYAITIGSINGIIAPTMDDQPTIVKLSSNGDGTGSGVIHYHGFKFSGFTEDDIENNIYAEWYDDNLVEELLLADYFSAEVVASDRPGEFDLDVYITDLPTMYVQPTWTGDPFYGNFDFYYTGSGTSTLIDYAFAQNFKLYVCWEDTVDDEGVTTSGRFDDSLDYQFTTKLSGFTYTGFESERQQGNISLSFDLAPEIENWIYIRQKKIVWNTNNTFDIEVKWYIDDYLIEEPWETKEYILEHGLQIDRIWLNYLDKTQDSIELNNDYDGFNIKVQDKYSVNDDSVSMIIHDIDAGGEREVEGKAITETPLDWDFNDDYGAICYKQITIENLYITGVDVSVDPDDIDLTVIPHFVGFGWYWSIWYEGCYIDDCDLSYDEDSETWKVDISFVVPYTYAITQRILTAGSLEFYVGYVDEDNPGTLIGTSPNYCFAWNQYE